MLVTFRHALADENVVRVIRGFAKLVQS